MCPEVWDTVVVGAGVLGCATAMHIKSMDPDRSVLLLDRNPRPGMGNTRRSVALFRDMFTSRTGRELARATIGLMGHIEGELGFNLALKRYGYYWMMDEARYEGMRPLLDKLEQDGVEFDVDDRSEVMDLLGEHLVPEPIPIRGRAMPHVEHAVRVHNAGTVSPTRLAMWYEREFRRLGGEVEYEFQVDSLELESTQGGPVKVWEGARLAAAVGPSGRRTAMEFVVAAGVWTPSLLDPLGVDCHVKSQTRQAFGLRGGGVDVLHVRNGFPKGELPVLILPAGGVFLKPVRAQRLLVAGCADRWGRPYALEDEPRAETSFLDSQVRPVVEAYFPRIKGSIVPVSWAGQYHYNTMDGNPIVFKESNVTVVVGASGSGIMKSDSIGCVAAAVHAGEPDTELFDGTRVRVSGLGVRDRIVEPEQLTL